MIATFATPIPAMIGPDEVRVLAICYNPEGEDSFLYVDKEGETGWARASKVTIAKGAWRP